MRYEAFVEHARQVGSYDTPPGRRNALLALPVIRRLYTMGVLVWAVVTAYVAYRCGADAETTMLKRAWWQVRGLEKVGGTVHLRGLEHIVHTPGAAVVVANHMSALETFVLPALVMSFRRGTFVLKESLLHYPCLGPLLAGAGAVGVTRTNPRADLKAVLDLGRELLGKGSSMIIFPQSTRTAAFDPAKFGTLGQKLAREAGVPIIPLALKTDMWTNGRYIKDFGPLKPERDIWFEFGPPIQVAESGRDAHDAVIAFIASRLDQWA